MNRTDQSTNPDPAPAQLKIVLLAGPGPRRDALLAILQSMPGSGKIFCFATLTESETEIKTPGAVMVIIDDSLNEKILEQAIPLIRQWQCAASILLIAGHPGKIFQDALYRPDAVLCNACSSDSLAKEIGRITQAYKRVLVIADQELEAGATLSVFLIHAGYNVNSVLGIKSGLLQLAKASPNLIFLEHRLLLQQDFYVVDEIRALTPAPIVLFGSRAGQEEPAVQPSLFSGYLAESFGPDELTAVINQAFSNAQPRLMFKLNGCENTRANPVAVISTPDPLRH